VPSRFIGSFFSDFFHPFVATAARRWIPPTALPRSDASENPGNGLSPIY
jgi:hypothetical protein